MGDHRGVLRTRAVLLASTGLLLTGCLSLEAPAPESSPPIEAGAPVMPTPVAFADTARLEPACPPPPSVPPPPLSAEQRNAMMDEVDLPAWEAADVGASAQLSDGRVFWVFGDTIRTPDFEPQLVSNSVLVTSGSCTSQLLTDETGPIVPETENGLSQWAMSVVRVPPRATDGEDVTDVLVAFYARTQRGERQWDFITRGTSAVVYVVGADGIPRMDEIVALTPDSVDLTHIHWGSAATVEGDHVYVYGTRATGVEQVYGRELYVSRLPLTEPTDVARWEIWDGNGWQADLQRAAPVLGAEEGVSQTLSVDRVDGRWLAVSKRGGDVEDNITVWTSDQPYGPWEAREVGVSIFTTEEGEIEYTPMAHPELTTPSGAMLISVSRNHSDVDLLKAEPAFGRPRFLEIRLD
jgi:hypothetical protein